MDGEWMAGEEQGMLTFVHALSGLYLPGAGRDRWAGQGLVEYALLLSLPAVMAIVALAYYHDSVAGVFVQVGDSLAAPGGAPAALAAPDTAGGGGETATRLVRLFTGGAPACPAPSNGRPCR